MGVADGLILWLVWCSVCLLWRLAVAGRRIEALEAEINEKKGKG